MPAKLVRRSAIGQPFMDLLRGGYAFGRGVHDFCSAIRTVSTGENPKMVPRPRQLTARALTNRDDHHVAGDGLSAFQSLDLDTGHGSLAVRHDALRCSIEPEAAPVTFGELVLVVITGHVGLATAIHDRGRRGAEPLRLRDRIDRGIAGADHHDLASNGGFAIRVRLEVLDEREG